MALISSLLLLLVVTILAISMFRSYGLQEKIAGNVREKQRALGAAVSAQQYAEWLLVSGTAPPLGQCSSVPTTASQICTNPINTSGINSTGDYTALPWAGGVELQAFTTDAGNGVKNVTSAAPTFSATGGAGGGAQTSYYDFPRYYIQDVGPQLGGGGEIYQIDAMGYGATPDAVAVVESTFLVTTNTAKSPDK